MDKYQTSNVKALDAWLSVVSLTYQLLYLSSTDTEVEVQLWEKYLPKVKKALQADAASQPYRKSIALTRKGAKKLFYTFDHSSFKPQESKNGIGRKEGTVQNKKKQYPPTRKYQNRQNSKQNVEQII